MVCVSDKDMVKEFFPFGGGRRACIGANQAKQKLRILFAEFVRRIEFDSIYSENNKWPGQQQAFHFSC